MITWFQAILLGIVEGVTEFLPISSTFHLIITSRLLGIPTTDLLKVFEVFIQAGAILAVVVLYWQKLWKNWKLGGLVVTAFVPTAILGFLLHDVVKGVIFEAWLAQIIVFAVIGVVFLGYEWWIQRTNHQPRHTLNTLTYRHAAIVGAIQAAAMVPGVSRAGAVMLGLMWLGYQRDDAAEFSFLLAVPTICAAALLDVIKMRQEILAATDAIPMFALGTVTAFITALLVLKWLIGYLQRHSLASFGWYRLGLAAILLAWTLLG